MSHSIRIAAGQGFWGDWLEAPVRQVLLGPIDYLMLDYLAEVTMSILAKQKSRRPDAGYARDFPALMAQLLPELVDRKVKVLTNAGGVNPRACAELVRQHAEALGLGDKVRIAIVTGDDILDQLDQLLVQGEMFENLDTARPFSDVRQRIQSANVYLGAEPLVEALKSDATIVITGRVSDASLALAPAMHEFGWKPDEWDRLAAGVIAGHIIECGAQSSGGNYSFDWEAVPNAAEIGFPIIEMAADGSFVVTKHEQTGGLVTIESVKEQLVYEIGDPTRYIGPDVVADFTSITLSDEGPNRVRVTGAKGTARPNTLKVSVSYRDGFMAAGTMLYSWPDAVRKAKVAGDIVSRRLAALALPLDRIHTEIIGANACHGAISDGDYPDAPEALLRVAVHGQVRDAVERFTREVAPLVLGGPPGATGYAGGKGAVQEVFGYWPTTVARTNVKASVTLL
ncbi:MAG: DUF1446 domain-containing protein [Bdellovibrionales bacterium]|nr:DUF1446 domain-containing protein [Bdellovibrionales bacterium]